MTNGAQKITRSLGCRLAIKSVLFLDNKTVRIFACSEVRTNSQTKAENRARGSHAALTLL